ncbi:MAG TPA: hypothetical protein VK348_03500 [Planctomycetota bacterium]|nr:hypothetical protein [Planctomycetota bacterium]
MRTTFLLAGAVLLAVHLPAQNNPTEEIKQIVERVDEQLKKIDELLQQSARKSGNDKKPSTLLGESQQQSEAAVQGLDELIEKLEQMRQQSKSRSQNQDQQQPQQQQDPQQQQQPQPGGQRNRRDSQTPDFVQQQQQQPKPGQNQPQPPGQPQGQPNDGPDPKGPGENVQGNRPPNQDTDKGQRGTGDDSWGDLQPYTNFLKNRGSLPKVPEKFRKYWEAYLKSKQEKKG